MSTPASGDDSDDLRAVERARLSALVSADVEKARAFHAPDFELVTPVGMTLSRDDYLGALASGRLRYLAWTPGSMVVRRYPGAAVLRYRADMQVEFGGNAMPRMSCWHTDLYEAFDDGWKVVWSQATTIQPLNG